MALFEAVPAAGGRKKSLPHGFSGLIGGRFTPGIRGADWKTARQGAASHDIRDGILDPAAPDFERRYRALKRTNAMFRVLGRSWRREEMPSGAEYAEAEANLERVGWRVDCVLTRCAPTSAVRQISRYGLTDFLKTVRQRCRFGRWFCGHYHINQVIDAQFVVQWEQISKAE